jgi:hypothetical protein
MQDTALSRTTQSSLKIYVFSTASASDCLTISLGRVINAESTATPHLQSLPWLSLQSASSRQLSGHERRLPGIDRLGL